MDFLNSIKNTTKKVEYILRKKFNKEKYAWFFLENCKTLLREINAFILVALLTTCFTEKKITSSLIPFFRNTVPNTEFFSHPETNI